MNTRDMAVDYIKRGRRCLTEAENAYNDADYPMAVRRSQECVEMSLKSILRALGIEYPRKHDVSDALDLIKANLPEWFSARIYEVKEISRDLARKRGPAMYGYEAELKPSSSIFDEEDAAKAVNSAKKVFELCNRFILEVLGGY